MSLCNHQNFPSFKDFEGGVQEIGFGENENLSLVLKNIPYCDIYLELDRKQTYNLRMLDGALIQMMYRFRNGSLESHRLAFFPSPNLEEFQNNPEIYLEDEIYAEVIMKNIVPFPLRFDFDNREGVAREVEHPKSHLTLGQYQNCRIPVSAPLTPYHFISFILRCFYNTAFKRYCENLTSFFHEYEPTILPLETSLLHVQIPRAPE